MSNITPTEPGLYYVRCSRFWDMALLCRIDYDDINNYGDHVERQLFVFFDEPGYEYKYPLSIYGSLWCWKKVEDPAS